jgi:hypothetical protein
MWSFDATLRRVTFFRDWESLAAFKGASFSHSDSQSSTPSAAAEDGDVKILLYTLSRQTRKKMKRKAQQLIQITYFNQKRAPQKPMFKMLRICFVVCIEGPCMITA